MAKKVSRVAGPALVFMSNESRSNMESEEAVHEAGEIIKFFGVEKLEDTVELDLSVEAMLWSLFEKVPAPESPLRLKAHERRMLDIASKLRATLETEELPELSTEEKTLVYRFLDDPEEFKTLTGPYEFKKEGAEAKYLRLPLSNVLRDSEFVATLDSVFAE